MFSHALSGSSRDCRYLLRWQTAAFWLPAIINFCVTPVSCWTVYSHPTSRNRTTLSRGVIKVLISQQMHGTKVQIPCFMLSYKIPVIGYIFFLNTTCRVHIIGLPATRRRCSGAFFRISLQSFCIVRIYTRVEARNETRSTCDALQ